MNFFKKPITILTTGLLFSGIVFTSNVDAAQAVKKLEANFRNIKIIYNSKAATIDPKTEPFIANGTTYVPLRMVSELFDKSVIWDAKNNTITVNDKTAAISPTVVANLNAQITAKDAQIKSKDAQIAQLQAEINKLKSSSTNLDDLEEQLNDDYGDYRDLDDVEITLSGNKSDITVRIDVDDVDWRNLSTSKKESFLQDIVDDILAEFKDADVEGTIRDADNSSKTLATFDIDSRDEVRIKNQALSLSALADQLYKDHKNHSEIDDIDIYLRGDEDDIELIIEVNESDWKASTLTNNEKIDFIEAIVDDILDEYEDAEITGRIEASSDNDKLNTFTVDSRGYVTIK